MSDDTGAGDNCERWQWQLPAKAAVGAKSGARMAALQCVGRNISVVQLYVSMPTARTCWRSRNAAPMLQASKTRVWPNCALRTRLLLG